MLDRPRLLLATAMIVVVAALNSRASAAEADAPGLRIVQDNSTVSILDGPRPVLRYRYADVPKKPYVDQLFSPAGVQVLRDSPSDHKHHHALMYALSVDGVNFWEEHLGNSGRQEHKSLADVKATVRDGIESAGFVEELEWVGPKSEKPLLIERRTIEVLNADDLGATLAQWRCRLQTPPGKDKMLLGGSFYFGLGMRMLVSMEGGRFFNAADKTAEMVRGNGPFVRSKWCAYTAKADGKPVTVALFDHPANLRHPATMYTKTEPFTYLSATLNEWQEPITVEAGKPLDLCYGVALWDGEPDKAAVERLYRRWLVLSKPRSRDP